MALAGAMFVQKLRRRWAYEPTCAASSNTGCPTASHTVLKSEVAMERLLKLCCRAVFSSRYAGGLATWNCCRAPMMRTTSKKVRDLGPLMPRPRPAGERSWHSQPATTSQQVPSHAPAASRAALSMARTSWGRSSKVLVKALSCTWLGC